MKATAAEAYRTSRRLKEGSMRYFFHLREEGRLILDEEGRELAGLDGVKAAAVGDARSIIAEAVMTGSLLLKPIIEVRDGEGRRVLDLPFRDAVTVDG